MTEQQEAVDAGRIWYPLFDTPFTLSLSREQLEAVRDALRGEPEPVPGWRKYFAGEIDRALGESSDE